ncbi:unnamed protein product, partial [Sphagnum compactum]
MAPVQTGLESFESEGRNWTPPAPIWKPATGLHVYNSLSREKVPFVTRDGSNEVTWYICGPTVYDSSHLGHARNYVTFDIIRRIMERYFQYSILYVMNVTDVDDKIINRARRNYLLDRFLATATDPGQKVEQEKLKLKKIEEVKGRFEKLKREACDLGGKEGVEKLLSGGIADILAAHLDVKGKASVTDHAIFRSHAARYEREFMEDMKSLGVQDPDVLTRVTEYIPQIIEYVQVILNHELAYVANNSVYFDTKAFRDAGHTYGKLNPWAVGSSELASESESNFETTEKRSSCDFALWKKSKEGEPAWNSPWGMGRPGWHIECSAMASDILGDCMDIHSGGHDLQFPHHDNELAQAEAYFNSSEWVKYFFHSGHLSIDGLKMSKSLKNFITIKEALQKYTSRQLRMLFVIHAWDKPINFSEGAVNEAVGKEKQFKNFFSNVQVEMRQAALKNDQRWADDEKQLQRQIQEVKSKVRVRLEDNFDTAGAVSELLLLVKDVHSYIDKCNSMTVKPRIFIVQKAAVYITWILSIFGLSDAGRGDIGFGSSGSEGVANTSSLEVVVAPYLDAFALFRDQVRTAAREGAPKETLLELADRVRDVTMVDLGVRFEDKGGKSTWKLDDPEVLRRERDQKIQKDKEKLVEKEVARRELEERKQKAREQKLQRKQQQQKAGRVSLSESFGSDDYVQQQKQSSTVEASDTSENCFQIGLPQLENDSILIVGRKGTFEGADAIEFLFGQVEDMSKVVGVGLQRSKVVVTEQFEVMVIQINEHMWLDLWKETSFVPMSINVPKFPINYKLPMCNLTPEESSKRFGVGLGGFRSEGLCMYVEDNMSKQTGEMFPLIFELAEKMGLKSENAKPSWLQHLKDVSTETMEGKVSDQGGSSNEPMDGGDHDQGATSHEPMEGAV